MSTEDTGADGSEQSESAAEEETQADPLADIKQELKNNKSESSRKIDNLTAQFAEIAAMLKPKVVEQPIDKNLVYDNPEEYARQIEDRAVAKAEQRVLGRVQANQNYQMKVASMQADFPEFKDENSEAYRLAHSEYNNLPNHLQGTNEGLEIAMQRAALKTGLQPVSKRKRTNNDDYIPPTTNTGRRPAPARETPEQTKAIEFAKVMAIASGRNPNDKDMLERVKEAAKRKSWDTFSEGEES